MVDIHCHLLPGVDDGAASTEIALEMLRRGAAEGIRAAVLTPHLSPGSSEAQEALHRKVFAGFASAVREAGLPVELYLGAEIGFRFGMVEVARWPSGSLAGGGRFALVDLPLGPLSPALEQAFFELRLAGFRPILAHPERHPALAGSPARIGRLRQQEVLIQIDAGSLTGQLGRRAHRAAESWVRQGWVEFVASDAHDLESRPFSLRSARARLEALGGSDLAWQLLVENPRRLLDGEEVESIASRPLGRGWRERMKYLLGDGHRA